MKFGKANLPLTVLFTVNIHVCCLAAFYCRLLVNSLLPTYSGHICSLFCNFVPLLPRSGQIKNNLGFHLFINKDSDINVLQIFQGKVC
jgi:hypothetical protein